MSSLERVDRARLKRMREILRHRGPDDEGLIIDGRAGLAHRRLSIIDLTSGRQPMSSADKQIWITYNGEIYNFRSLRTQLIGEGYTFNTQSDTEVILRAYERYGEQCVRHLRGMFAFAIWDGKRQKLILARDRLGIKPLYYAVNGNEILFGSEIKAILAAETIEPAFNRTILPEYLANGFVAGDETFFSGIHKLLPGHMLVWTPGKGIRRSRYWQLPTSLERTNASIQRIAEEVREQLEEAVHCHLVSDVPVGLFLSGGIDSSALAALMAPMMPEQLQTFSIGFAERDGNELAYARQMAQTAAARHREMILTPAEFFAALPHMVWHEDEPIAFPSSISLYFVSRLASRHVKVVLTGEGADELFLGYNRYRVTAWNARLGRPYWSAVPPAWRDGISRMVQNLPKSLRRYARRSFLGQPAGMHDLFHENFAVFPERLQRELLVEGTPLGNPYSEAERYFQQAPGGILERMSYADMQSYLVELLMKQDQMSMAASIESRVPFLDHRFVEYAAAIPGRYKLRGWQTKAVLKLAVKDLLPREIYRRGKMGFPVPLGGWLRHEYTPLLDELVLGPRASQRGLFNTGYLQRLVAEHREGIQDHSAHLWMLMNLEIWQRIFIEGERPETVLGPGWAGEPLEAVA